MENNASARESSEYLNPDSMHHQNQDNGGNHSNIGFCKNFEDYILKFVSLLFLRGIKFKEFYLECNITGGETFGDIVIKFVNDDKCQVFLVHVEIPQKDSITFDIIDSNDQFNLVKCFQSINMIEENFKSSKTLQDLGDFDDFEFIFFTSASVFETCTVKTCNDPSYDILNTAESRSVIYIVQDEALKETVECFQELQMFKKFLEQKNSFQNPEEIIQKLNIIRPKIHSDYIKERLQILQDNPTPDTFEVLYAQVQYVQCIESHSNVLHKFKLYSDQASVERLNDLIKCEILRLENISNFGAHLIHSFLLHEIEAWWISHNRCLKNNMDIWETFIIKMKNFCEMQKPIVETIPSKGIKFFHFSIKNIKSSIMQYRVLNIVASSFDISLTCLKVLQALDQIAPHKYLWISFYTLIRWREEVLQTWFNDVFSILVIENESTPKDLKNVVNEIVQVLRMDHRKYVIIISAEKNKFTSSLKNTIFPDDYCELKDTFRFVDLDDQSQIRILKNDVKFQGQLTSMGSLIGSSNDLKGSLSASVVSRLIRGEASLTIGPPLVESIANFIPRTLELLIELDISIIKSIKKTEIFVVSGTSLPELRKILLNEDIQLYSTENQEVNSESNLFCLETSDLNVGFLTLCERFPFKNVHHLIFKKESLWWRESKGQTKYLKDYLIIRENARHIWDVIERSRTSYYTPLSLLDSVEYHMIILGESGVGKSTLLTSLQKTTKMEAPLNWLIHLDFNNDIKLIVKTKKEDYDCEVLIQIMYSLLRYEHHASEIEHILLRFDFEKRGNVVIICEGLDSVNPVHINKVIEFINALGTMKVKKLWLASSHNTKTILEKSFRTVVSEIHPLSSEEQMSLLDNLWREKHPNVEEKHLKNFIMCLQQVLNVNKSSLLSIPLLCMMTAEIFETQFTEYVSSTSVNWPEKIDIAQIFHRFICQRRLYYIHKSNPNLSDAQEIHEEQEDFFLNRHMLCALFSILDIPDLEELHLLDVFENVSKLVEEVKKFGIIQRVVNKKPVFLHKTLAEYFGALWFSKNIEKSREFLKHKLFVSNFKSVLRFFDYFLIKGHELHNAVLKNDFQSIKSLLTYGVDCSSTDKGGRTALHLAIVYSPTRVSSFPVKDLEDNTHDNITKLLVNHSINTKMIDHVLLWRPVQYAIELKKWDAMDLLLKEQIDFNDIEYLKEKVKDELFVQEGLLIGSEKGYFNLIECFSCCGINISENVIQTDEGQYSSLHIAARYGQLKLVRYLLSKKVKISIKDNRGISPLHLAASEGMIDVLVYLLQRGADLHCLDRDGNTPLNFAIFKCDLHMVILLIEQYHSNTNFQNKFGDTPLHHAVKVGHITIIEYLLMKGAQIDVGNRDSNTALHIAVWIGELPVVKLLLEYGANVSACNKYGDTPLSYNAGGGNLEIVKMLVENGADVHKKNDEGNTALHWAARQNNESVVEYLLSKGADINVQNKYGNTALHRAVEHGCLVTTKYLINAGCNIKLQNTAGCTAVKMRSRSKEVADCVAYL